MTRRRRRVSSHASMKRESSVLPGATLCLFELRGIDRRRRPPRAAAARSAAPAALIAAPESADESAASAAHVFPHRRSRSALRCG